MVLSSSVACVFARYCSGCDLQAFHTLGSGTMRVFGVHVFDLLALALSGNGVIASHACAVLEFGLCRERSECARPCHVYGRGCSWRPVGLRRRGMAAASHRLPLRWKLQSCILYAGDHCCKCRPCSVVLFVIKYSTVSSVLKTHTQVLAPISTPGIGGSVTQNCSRMFLSSVLLKMPPFCIKPHMVVCIA